jgi:histidine triad (HIT) family protein
LVVPKAEVDKIYDLSDEDYHALWASVKKVAQRLEEVSGRRTLMKVIGTDVPHAHVHLMPFDETWEYGRTLSLTEDEFKEIRDKLAF